MQKLDYRCTGNYCLQAMKCRRYVERIVPKGTISRYAAFHVRREPGSNACDHVLWVTERQE